MQEQLKAPFPYFGGKSRIASLVWKRLGEDLDNYIEPFCGSSAVLLARPDPHGVETINDGDAYVSNVWRSISRDPEAVAAWADQPVSELDLHAEHRWLVGAFPEPKELPADVAADPALTAVYLRGWRDSYGPFDGPTFRKRLREDVDYFDTRAAGLWLNGICMWIGGGWCSHNDGPGQRPNTLLSGVHAASRLPVNLSAGSKPAIMSSDGKGQGVHKPHKAVSAKKELQSKVRIAAHNKGSVGKGVHAGGGLSAQITEVTGEAGASGRGVHAKRPRAHSESGSGHGGSLPGIHALAELGTCDERRAWLIDWFCRLRDRLRLVRICCGDWSRVCSSPSVTTRLGTTGVYLDPPYPRRRGDGSRSRAGNLYATDRSGASSPEEIQGEVLQWCRAMGSHRLMRIVVSAYDSDGYQALVDNHGWTVEEWATTGGYGNRTGEGKENARRERLYVSPHCVREKTLFDELEAP